MKDPMAALAESLLTPMASIVQATTDLRQRVRDGEGATSVELLDTVIAESRRTIDMLRDLVRSGDPEVVSALDSLRADHETPSSHDFMAR
ncbi:MAG TPA: hypothetical protein VFU93_15510 [Acidimicrobiales bacterium]|nr:hypothetical protein [Acidimicrobiales bacterium]